MTDKVNNNASRGFGSFSDEKKKKIHQKSLETRQKKKLAREENEKAAGSKRKRAARLRKQAEQLEQEADEFDGQISSDKARKKYEADLADEISITFGASVSTQYLKTMIQFAILYNKTAKELVTPTMAAMEMLVSTKASQSDKKEAIKLLAPFEVAKPAVKEEEIRVIGSVEENINKLMELHSSVAPRGES